VTTYRNVRCSGGIEVHPVQRIVFELFGPAAGVPVAKLLQVGFVLLVARVVAAVVRMVALSVRALYGLAAANNHSCGCEANRS
jgi:hypothetical protein